MFLESLNSKLTTVAKVVGAIVLIVFVGYLANYLLWGDNANRISRMGVSYLDGDYTVTHYAYTGDKVWTVESGKITTEADKGYYFFWATIKGTSNKAYVQVPIEATSIQQIFEVI
jgi:hypothetical protein